MPFNDKTNNMNLLSLFNGMSCSKMAFDQLNIPISKFYVSEIDKYANKLTSYLYPEAIHLGSVVDVDVTKLDKIDFIAAGSPCQSFSFAGKRKGMATKCEEEILSLEKYLELKSQGFEFEGQSYLFWEFIRIYQDCKKINPEVKFLLENVEMGEKWEKVLSRAVGYNGIHINSALVSAQNRKRIYWINFGLEPRGLFNDLESIVQQPKDKGILLKDILETEVDEKYFLSEKMINCLVNRTKTENYFPCKFQPIKTPFEEKSRTINQRIAKMGDADNYIKIDKQGNIKDNQDKASCFTAGGHSRGNHSDMDLIVHNTMPRSSTTGKGGTGPLSRNDEKTYCLDTGNTNAIEFKCVAMRGRNPENPKSRVIGLETEQQLESRKDQKTNCLTSVQKDNLIILTSKDKRLQKIVDDNTFIEGEIAHLDTYNQTIDKEKSPALKLPHNDRFMFVKSRIRRLTPKECLRLQTIPEHLIEKILTSGTSDTQIYKMAGNGWTVKVIAHLLQYLNLTN
jgi:DNA (cytosine-5)-methyltransferase 3A